jgi:hypothetical protein
MYIKSRFTNITEFIKDGVIMSKKEPKKKLVGPWRSIHVMIWMVGLFILISRDWIFPGIFVLIAISAIYEGLLARYAPHAFEEVIPDATASPVEEAPTTTTPWVIDPSVSTPPAAMREHRLELLPQLCPNCNAPVRGYMVKWTGPQSADCPYCGSNLPMTKA